MAGLMSERCEHNNLVDLSIEELEWFVGMLKSRSDGFAECTVPSVLTGLLKTKHNRDLFKQHEFDTLLWSLSSDLAVQQMLCGLKLSEEMQNVSTLPSESQIKFLTSSKETPTEEVPTPPGVVFDPPGMF